MEKLDDYLRELFKAGGVDSSTFYSSRLKRLFFEGLAIEGKQNDPAYGEVAFLNGGLFEESKFDKAISDLPDECLTRFSVRMDCFTTIISRFKNQLPSILMLQLTLK